MNYAVQDGFDFTPHESDEADEADESGEADELAIAPGKRPPHRSTATATRSCLRCSRPRSAKR
jgi:hypothetical protein